MASPINPRSVALREITQRPVRITSRPEENGVQQPTSIWFGCNTLSLRQMRSKLPKSVYAKLAAAIRLGKKLDSDIAPTVAQVIKEWATSRGVTHFTHWFQPQTGLTAEKHDAVLNVDENKRPSESVTGEQLRQAEPEAASCPSGQSRNRERACVFEPLPLIARIRNATVAKEEHDG